MIIIILKIVHNGSKLIKNCILTHFLFDALLLSESITSSDSS